MPIVKLKECIEKCTGVPTHQQRLMIGSTIVEDWDDEDRMMFIGNYPNIHDGSLLYLVQLEGGSRMIVYYKNMPTQMMLVRQGSGTMEYHYQTTYFYVNSVMVSVILHRSWPYTESVSHRNGNPINASCSFSHSSSCIDFVLLTTCTHDHASDI